ncbi:MAG: hypothetical protein V3V84_08880 [Candidatus Bathyarchaeia archaeon]
MEISWDEYQRAKYIVHLYDKRAEEIARSRSIVMNPHLAKDGDTDDKIWGVTEDLVKELVKLKGSIKSSRATALFDDRIKTIRKYRLMLRYERFRSNDKGKVYRYENYRNKI